MITFTCGLVVVYKKIEHGVSKTLCVRVECSEKQRSGDTARHQTEYHNRSSEAAAVCADSQSYTVEVDRL